MDGLAPASVPRWRPAVRGGSSTTIPTTSWTRRPQRHIDRFVGYYNHTRPHRALNRRTPAAVHADREKATPNPTFVKADDRRLRLDRVDRYGRVTLRYQGQLHHIGIGNPYAGWRVAMLIDGLNIEIVTLNGEPLRRLVLDPTTNYQRIP